MNNCKVDILQISNSKNEQLVMLNDTLDVKLYFSAYKVNELFYCSKQDNNQS